MRIFYLMLVFISFGFAACDNPKTSPVSEPFDGKSQKDEFIALLKADHEAGVSYRDITYKLAMRGYEEKKDEFDNLGDDGYEVETENFEEETVNLVENIRSGKCDLVWQYLEQQYPGIKSRNVELMGIFYDEGICLKSDPSKAAEIYKIILQKGIRSPTSVARLGALYWNGRGVVQDRQAAEKYFQKALIWMAPSFFSGERNDLFYDAKDTLDFKIWGLTVRQADLNFVTLETGPWELPEPLMRKTQWLQSLAETGGEKVFALAQSSFKGADGYDRDLETAILLMGSAGYYFDNPEALFLSDLWRVDESICNERKALEPLIDCELEISIGIDLMEGSAFKENKKAIIFLIDHFQTHPDEGWADWKLYQYLVLAKKLKLAFDSEVMNAAKNSLGSFEQQIIEAWVDVYSRSISDNLPD